jgi:O-antigen/teichoic acid export membrane protein
VSAFIITIIATALNLFSFVLVGINQGLTRNKSVALGQISGNILYFISTLCFLVIFNKGILSIAYSNVIRAIWIIAINLIPIESKHPFENTVFDRKYTKHFSRIFIHTASSKIAGTVSNNLDLVLIARYLPVQFVTLFEINRRPIKMLQGLTGRYSTALMPIISMNSNLENFDTLSNLLKKQIVRYFALITISIGCLIVFGPFMIEIWLGNKNFIGNFPWFILCVSSLMWLIGYFFSNVLFAFGDIKYNSNISILRSISYLTATSVGLHFGGLQGLILAQLVSTICVDVIFFVYRFIKLQFLSTHFLILCISLCFACLILLSILSAIRIVYMPELNYQYLILLSLIFTIISFCWFFASNKMILKK